MELSGCRKRPKGACVSADAGREALIAIAPDLETESGTDSGCSLPDLLAESIDLLFVGINPGLTSARRGHYYAGPGNMFWKCLHLGGLTPVELRPEEDRRLLEFGIGVTDCVKRPSRTAAEVKRGEFRNAAPDLIAKIERCSPRLVCFNGLTCYRTAIDPPGLLGIQPTPLAGAVVFVVPSTSGANAGFSRDERIQWFRRLNALRERLASGESACLPGDILK